MPPHSKTVRGTLSHPKLDTTSNPPQVGDPISVEREKDDSAPANSSNSLPETSSNQNKSELPHSKSVRGTLANASGPTVNKSMLGDPVSLKAETSDTGLDKGAGSGGKEQEESQMAANKRTEAGRSKL